jgi:SanA protein
LIDLHEPAATDAPGATGPDRVPEHPYAEPESRPQKRPRPLLSLLIVGVLVAMLLPLALDFMVSASAGDAVADEVEQAREQPVALLLGTSRKTAGGRPNQFYDARIASAAALFHSGKVQAILVSGDNATRWYNEPVSMQKDLIAAGVPAEYITLDYAGFRTLDSVIRAKEVFGQDRLIVVSQRFHAERAIFLARHFGIDASGLAAADPDDWHLFGIRAREVFARVAAVLDIVSGREPKFLGEPETVRLRAKADHPARA